MEFKRAVKLYLIVVLSACSSADQTTIQEQVVSKRQIANEFPASDDVGMSDSLSRFVQSFYDWYAPLTIRESETPPWVFALQQRDSMLSSRLSAALWSDYEAQTSSYGELVGLDFDPFLGSQDPCTKYKVGRTTHRGQGYSVEVLGMCPGNSSIEPDVIANLVLQNGNWVFDNFYYPVAQSDLLSVLKRLQQAN